MTPTEPKTLEEFLAQYPQYKIDSGSVFDLNEFAQALLEWVRKEVVPRTHHRHKPKFLNWGDNKIWNDCIAAIQTAFDRLEGK